MFNSVRYKLRENKPFNDILKPSGRNYPNCPLTPVFLEGKYFQFKTQKHSADEKGKYIYHANKLGESNQKVLLMALPFVFSYLVATPIGSCGIEIPAKNFRFP